MVEKQLKEQVFISMVIYVHNHEKSISHTLETLWSLMHNTFENFEFIIINDDSQDKTREHIKAFSETRDAKKITLINLGTKYGLETGMQMGIDFSIGDFVFELDSPDLNFDPEKLICLYETACRGYDIVSLTAETNQRLSSRLFYRILKQFSRMDLDLDTHLAHILTRRAINSISRVKDRVRYRRLSHLLHGYKHTSIEAKLGQKIPSSYNLTEKIRLSSDILFSFTDIGMQLNIYLALTFLFFSLFLGSYAIYQWLTYDKIIEGWTTIMLFLSFGFSGLFFVLSIINKYLSLALTEIRSVPGAAVEGIEKL